MKRPIVALAVLFALAAALQPSIASASEAWVLNIPVRGIPNQESGMVRATLELSAAPAGAQLVVGSTTLNLGQTLVVAGDSVTFEALTGNNVRITYVPLSNFGADFCAGGGAQDKNILMRFVGAQDVVAYRMSTYIVAAPMAECSQVSKHTGDTPASLIPNDDGVAPALDAIYKGRNMFDVALVLDKSGSMNDLPPGALNGPKKIDILKSAVQNFVGQWELLDAPPGGGAEWSGDRMGLVFFDSTAQPQSLIGADPPANFFLQRGNAMPMAWDAIITKANALVPGSATSIGAGINEGMSQWKADPKNDLNLIVITDGMQNTAPLITPTASGFLGLAPVAGLPQELRKRFIPIQTVGFGTPAQVDEDLLRNISVETSGISYKAINASTIFDVFGKTLVAILKGNTASMATHQLDTLTGTGPTAAVPVTVDRSPQRVVFSVQWAPPARQMLDLDVFPPGFATPATPTAAKKTPQASIQAFDMARGFKEGAWSVRVKRDLKSEDAVPYTLNVIFLEKHLDYQFSLDNLHAVTGDSLNIHVLVDWDGKPLTGLPAGAIRVRVQQQRDGMGNILHASKAKTPGGNTVTPSGDIQTPYDAKIAALAQTIIDGTAMQDVAVITLSEEGKGIYSGKFSGTSIPGQYAFEAVLDWDIPLTGHVVREERLEEDVKPLADSGRTSITMTTDASGITTLTVTPRDRYGNYFGPGYAPLVKATVRSGGKLRNTIPDDSGQYGIYSFTIAGTPGVTPVVDVFVDGVLVSGR
ncbi:MAG: hypothetical protein QOC81_4868 [Thermoanaerobaculia bacterium]|jgi:hypothetical protein|nr:hypothetical protein [Thermoanaerobaculia bacterium]